MVLGWVVLCSCSAVDDVKKGVVHGCAGISEDVRERARGGGGEMNYIHLVIFPVCMYIQNEDVYIQFEEGDVQRARMCKDVQ